MKQHCEANGEKKIRLFYLWQYMMDRPSTKKYNLLKNLISTGTSSKKQDSTYSTISLLENKE
jgi:hypothetical protein